jgi:hypothetical protein
LAMPTRADGLRPPCAGFFKNGSSGCPDMVMPTIPLPTIDFTMELADFCCVGVFDD